MARTSRRTNAAVKDARTDTVYRVAVYARLSNEDTGCDTLENQIDLLKSYVSEQTDMKLAGVLSDNGFSGTNFERPQFTEMMERIKTGEFNCIVVKDLSRLGRNYIETGDYIEKVFPFLKVRFVAVTDHFDTAKGDSAADMIVSIKNLVNDVYAKDISRKIITSFRTKQKNGEFIGLVAPYGYLKSKEDKHRFVVDDVTAPIVRMIYQLKLEGYGNDKIARMLNEKGIPSPRRYRYQIGVTISDRYADCLWARSAVNTILTNQAYLGHMVQGKEKQELCNNVQKHLTHKSEWIIVKNQHEAIIDNEIFDAVQKVITEKAEEVRIKKRTSKSSTIKEENYLKGYVKCGCCGNGFNLSQFMRGNTPTRKYYCRGYKQWRESYCTNRYQIDKAVLESTVLETVKTMVFQLQDIVNDKRLTAVDTAETGQKNRLKLIRMETTKLNRRMAELYADYEAEILDANDYCSMKKGYQDQYEEAVREEKLLQKILNERMVSKEAMGTLSEQLKKFRRAKKLNREMVEMFVQEVVIVDKETYQVILKGTDTILSERGGAR